MAINKQGIEEIDDIISNQKMIYWHAVKARTKRFEDVNSFYFTIYHSDAYILDIDVFTNISYNFGKVVKKVMFWSENISYKRWIRRLESIKTHLAITKEDELERSPEEIHKINSLANLVTDTQDVYHSILGRTI